MDTNDEVKRTVQEDYAHDVRSYMETLKSVVVALCIVLALLVAGLVALTIHNQNKMVEETKHHQEAMVEIANHCADKIVELLSEYDWQVEYEIETTDNEFWSGNVIIGQ